MKVLSNPMTDDIATSLRNLGLTYIDCGGDTLTAATDAVFGFFDDGRTSGIVLGLDLEQHYPDAQQEI